MCCFVFLYSQQKKQRFRLVIFPTRLDIPLGLFYFKIYRTINFSLRQSKSLLPIVKWHMFYLLQCLEIINHWMHLWEKGNEEKKGTTTTAKQILKWMVSQWSTIIYHKHIAFANEYWMFVICSCCWRSKTLL